jgi:molybdopterin-binding protein
VPHYRVSVAAELLGVSVDTLRRLLDSEALTTATDPSGRVVVDGASLAHVAQKRARAVEDRTGVLSSARNRFVGLVTDIKSDPVMSQVELQCGPFRVVSLMSTEAVRELGLAPGVMAVAVVKSTTVIVEVPREDAP